MRPLVAGDSSDGLSTKQLPAAMAPIYAQYERQRNKKNMEITRHGSERQPDRIVEGSDGQDETLGFLSNDRVKGSKGYIEARSLRSGPLVDVVIGNLAVADG